MNERKDSQLTYFLYFAVKGRLMGLSSSISSLNELDDVISFSVVGILEQIDI